MCKLEVPGNIVLLGEYAVLEEGGLGVVIAIDRKISLTLEPADSFEVKGQWGEKSIDWTPENPESDRLIASVYRESQKSIREFGSDKNVAPCKIIINSDAFRTSLGQKFGFGASAAVACGLTRTLFAIAGLENEIASQFKSALQGHRQAQGARGSGYDIATSLYGGIGLFKGGRHPQWKSLELPWLPPGYLFAGPNEFSTISAVTKYYDFKSRHNTETERFLSSSNDLVEQFIQSGNWQNAMKILTRYRDESIRFQKKLKIDATLSRHPDFRELDQNWMIKALGAGNELGSLWGNVEIPNKNELVAVNICESGPQWVRMPDFKRLAESLTRTDLRGQAKRGLLATGCNQ